MKKTGWSVTWVLAVAIGFAFRNGWLYVPDRWNPWAPLSVDEAPNFLTRYKLDRLAGDPLLCRSVLKGTALHYTLQPDRDAANGCGWDNAVRITATPTRVSQPFVLECPAAAALALWERYSVQPLAQRYFGEAVTRIDHFGSYACRNVVGGAADGRRSEHAYANALDVAGFVLADGRAVRVASDWRDDLARARFLHQVHDEACRYWNVVLGPDYNAAHHDHLHLDRGPGRACR